METCIFGFLFAYDFRDAVKRLSGDTRSARRENISKKTVLKKRLSKGFSDGGFADFMGSRGFSPPFGIVATILCGEVASPCCIQVAMVIALQCHGGHRIPHC